MHILFVFKVIMQKQNVGMASKLLEHGDLNPYVAESIRVGFLDGFACESLS